MPFRITRPWLLLDWVYSMTETAAAEHNQKKRLNKFTREVSSYFPSKFQQSLKFNNKNPNLFR